MTIIEGERLYSDYKMKILNPMLTPNYHKHTIQSVGSFQDKGNQTTFNTPLPWYLMWKMENSMTILDEPQAKLQEGTKKLAADKELHLNEEELIKYQLD